MCLHVKLPARPHSHHANTSPFPSSHKQPAPILCTQSTTARNGDSKQGTSPFLRSDDLFSPDMLPHSHFCREPARVNSLLLAHSSSKKHDFYEVLRFVTVAKGIPWCACSSFLFCRHRKCQTSVGAVSLIYWLRECFRIAGKGGMFGKGCLSDKASLAL